MIELDDIVQIFRSSCTHNKNGKCTVVIFRGSKLYCSVCGKDKP